MEFLAALDVLFKDKSYQAWKKNNPDSYLVHGVLFDGTHNPWNIGFCNPARDTLTVFLVDQTIAEQPEENAFKESKEHIIAALDANALKMSFTQIFALMEESAKKHKELVTKRIFVVQHITEGIVWNNTYVTQSLKTLNVKIDCQSGEVLSENLQSILSMTRQVK